MKYQSSGSSGIKEQVRQAYENHLGSVLNLYILSALPLFLLSPFLPYWEPPHWLPVFCPKLISLLSPFPAQSWLSNARVSQSSLKNHKFYLEVWSTSKCYKNLKAVLKTDCGNKQIQSQSNKMSKYKKRNQTLFTRVI